MSRTVLVTGGAGYVGSHVCLALANAGFTPVVYDDLSSGHADFVQWGPFEHGDVRDTDRLETVFATHRPHVVLHFAAKIDVAESMRDPDSYYSVNTQGTRTVAEAALRGGAQAMVFSSTCAVYGEPEQPTLDEDHPRKPINPYGRSKQLVEDMLWDLDRTAGFRSAMLRYFNAAGADPDGRIGERREHETHAVPLAIAAVLGQRPAFKVFGTDYDTRDGTAVRDYVHVLDLAEAHILALRRLLDGGDTQAFNLGSGDGATVRELAEAVSRVSGAPFPMQTAPRRAGDAAVLVADNAKARRMLGWSPTRGLEEIVGSAWRWHLAEAAR